MPDRSVPETAPGPGVHSGRPGGNPAAPVVSSCGMEEDRLCVGICGSETPGSRNALRSLWPLFEAVGFGRCRQSPFRYAEVRGGCPPVPLLFALRIPAFERGAVTVRFLRCRRRV